MNQGPIGAGAAEAIPKFIVKTTAAVLDCFNGEIVGLAMDDNMRKELCIQAFESACKARNARGMIFHSDRGSQFTSYAFRESLSRYGAIQSMSGTGRCYDNAVINPKALSWSCD